MALFSGHISLLFSRCAFGRPLIEVNQVTKRRLNPNKMRARLIVKHSVVFHR